MDKDRNLDHWNSWAQAFGTDLRSTTKCQSIKALEIAALSRRVGSMKSGSSTRRPLRVLEVGCGNALNGIALCSMHSEILWLGVDFSPVMVAQASKNISMNESHLSLRMSAVEGDAITLTADYLESKIANLPKTISQELSVVEFDVIYTDRCLINLASSEDQVIACSNIRRLLHPTGRFLMLENSVQCHERLNKLRNNVGLQSRPVAEFNVFIDEQIILPQLDSIFDLISVDDFGSLHDVLLYVLKPSIHAHREIVYDDDLMQTATSLLLALGEESATFGNFGQNRLWTFQPK